MSVGNQKELQAAAERAVFHEFAIRQKLAIDLSSIKSREPPEPDISCRCSDGRGVAFELVSLSDPDVAEQINRRKQEPTSAMFVGGPNFKAVRKKGYIRISQKHDGSKSLSRRDLEAFS